MSVKSRIIAIRLIEKVKDYPDYAYEIGLSVNTRKKDSNNIIEKVNEGEKIWEKEQQLAF